MTLYQKIQNWKLNKIKDKIEKIKDKIEENQEDMALRRRACSTYHMNKDMVLSNKMSELITKENELEGYLR